MEGIELVASRPGQISLAINKLKDNQALARELADRFAAIRGINQVEMDAVQGLMSIAYDKQSLTSLRSLLDLKEVFSCYFPEIDAFKFAAWIGQCL